MHSIKEAILPAIPSSTHGEHPAVRRGCAHNFGENVKIGTERAVAVSLAFAVAKELDEKDAQLIKDWSFKILASYNSLRLLISICYVLLLWTCSIYNK